MIIVKTPFRISFCGGGSDIKEYYSLYGGAVVSTTINKYVYLSMHPYFYKSGYLLKYMRHEEAESVDQIRHRIIREVFKDYGIKGVDFNSSADIPSGTGLGSSSSFTVGLINLCNIYTGKYMSKYEIAEYACRIEIERLKEPIGKQDQYAASFGGLNFITFNQDDTVNIEKIFLNRENLEQLQKNLAMFFTGETRSASKILTDQKNNLSNNSKKLSFLHKMVSLTYDLKNEFMRGNIDALGEILHTGWMYKKELADGISNEKIDYYYNLALKNGAIGGKLLGAGGGGFLLFYVKEEDREQLIRALSDLYRLDFRFETQGTTLIYYE
ncbi:MAG: GHMP kinase [Proteobacteria bacterium]|nr:GHMP kinase [Pseudomonadota bacterium]